MSVMRVVLCATACALGLFPTAVWAQGQRRATAKSGTVTFNTVFTKLGNGEHVFCNTLNGPDIEAARKACAGVDYIWIEMQHSPITWRECQDLINVIVDEGSIPFVRIPKADASSIQKATDSGALGIVVPMVETVEEVQNAVKFARNPIMDINNPSVKPWGKRSQGNNTAGRLWGRDFNSNYNNNIFIMIQIETAGGVTMIDRLLEVEGVNGVMVASGDFGKQVGDRDGDPTYNAREEIVRKSVLAHGLTLIGPSGWYGRDGYTMYQGTKPDSAGRTQGSDDPGKK